MEVKLCQVCKKREVYKRLTSNLDGNCFLVCEKKKCIKKLYSELEGETEAESESEFVRMVKWNPNEYQGRSYRQIKTNDKVLLLMWTFFKFGLIILLLYGLASFLY